MKAKMSKLLILLLGSIIVAMFLVGCKQNINDNYIILQGNNGVTFGFTANKKAERVAIGAERYEKGKFVSDEECVSLNLRKERKGVASISFDSDKVSYTLSTEEDSAHLEADAMGQEESFATAVLTDIREKGVKNNEKIYVYACSKGGHITPSLEPEDDDKEEFETVIYYYIKFLCNVA